MNEFLSAFTSGLGTGSVYALVAVGFAFIYRTTASFNFAQGQLLTLGSLFAYTLYVAVGLPAIVCVLIVMIVVGLLGGLVERVAIWPLAARGDSTLTWLISTLGVAVLFTGAAERIWGTQPLAVSNYVGPSVIKLHVSGVNVATPYLIAFIVAIAAAVIIELFTRLTLWGRAMRAVGDNRNAVELAGVNVVGLGFVAFALGGALAGLAGFVLAPVTYAQADTGFNFAILSFAALAIGGFSSHWGGLLGGWLVGVVEALAGSYIGLNYADLVVLGMLVLVLLISPEGFTGLRVRQV